MNIIVKTMLFVNIYHNEEAFFPTSYYFLPSVKHIVKTLLTLNITAFNNIILRLVILRCGKLVVRRLSLLVRRLIFRI